MQPKKKRNILARIFGTFFSCFALLIVYGFVKDVFIMPYMFPAPTAFRTATPARPPTVTSRPPTATRIYLHQPTATPVNDCLLWSKITIADKGKQVCIYGTVERVRETYGAWQIRFTSDETKFFLSAGSYYYPDIVKGTCVNAEGIVLLSSEKVPYINIDDRLNFCE